MKLNIQYSGSTQIVTVCFVRIGGIKFISEEICAVLKLLKIIGIKLHVYLEYAGKLWLQYM